MNIKIREIDNKFCICNEFDGDKIDIIIQSSNKKTFEDLIFYLKMAIDDYWKKGGEDA